MQNDIITNIAPPESTAEFLNRLNLMLASDHNYRRNIDTALKMIGNYIHNDRIHIIEIHQDMTFSISHEWCNRLIYPVKDTTKKHKVLFNKELEQQLFVQDYITLDESDESTDCVIRDLLNEYQCKNTILFPLFASGNQFAFIAFCQCNSRQQWNEETIRLMNTLASIIAANLDKNRLIDQLFYHLERKQKQEGESNLLKSRLNTLTTDLLTAWEDMKQHLENSGVQDKWPDINKLDSRVRAFEKLCRKMATNK